MRIGCRPDLAAIEDFKGKDSAKVELCKISPLFFRAHNPTKPAKYPFLGIALPR